MATEQEVSRNYEEEEEYDDDDDDYTTEEEEILFDKRITFFSKEDDWKVNLFCYFFLRLHKCVVVLFLYPPPRSCLLVKRGGSLSFLTIFTFAVPELLDLI